MTDEPIYDMQLRAAEVAASKPKFTPGPWRWNRDGQLERYDGGLYVLFGCCKDPHCEASIDGMKPDLALIAAAPDLYAALKELEWCAGVSLEFGGYETGCPQCEALEDSGKHAPDCSLAAALAKAEGREVQP